MPTIRRSTADIDRDKLIAELAAQPRPSEEEIDGQAAEDDSAWSDEELARVVLVTPQAASEEVRRLVQEGSDSGSGIDAAAVFDRLRARFGRSPAG